MTLPASGEMYLAPIGLDDYVRVEVAEYESVTNRHGLSSRGSGGRMGALISYGNRMADKARVDYMQASDAAKVNSWWANSVPLVVLPVNSAVVGDPITNSFWYSSYAVDNMLSPPESTFEYGDFTQAYSSAVYASISGEDPYDGARHLRIPGVTSGSPPVHLCYFDVPDSVTMGRGYKIILCGMFKSSQPSDSFIFPVHEMSGLTAGGANISGTLFSYGLGYPGITNFYSLSSFNNYAPIVRIMHVESHTNISSVRTVVIRSSVTSGAPPCHVDNLHLIMVDSVVTVPAAMLSAAGSYTVSPKDIALYLAGSGYIGTIDTRIINRDAPFSASPNMYPDNYSGTIELGEF